MPEPGAAPADRRWLARRNTDAARARHRRGARARLRLWLLRLAGALWPPPPPARAARRIAVLRPDHLGDVLFATPALRALRQALPEAHITVLAGPWGAPALAGSPDLDALVTLPFPGFARRPSASVLQPYRLLLEWSRRLGSSFDAALILRRDHWWGAWLALAAGIPLRVGCAVPETAPFLSQAIPHRPGGHEAVQNLALVAEFARLAGAPARHEGGIARTPDPISHPLRFRPAAGDAAAADALLERAGLSGPLAAIHPGSGADVKLWRAEGWAAVAGALARERGARVVLTGSADERELCAAIAAQCASPVVNAAGATTLGGLAALYARCRLVLGPDSGPLHLAVTQGTPTVHLFGPADPVAFGPWGPPERHRVVTPAIGCAPCGVLDWNEPLELHPCVRELPVEAVLAAARAVWPRGA